LTTLSGLYFSSLLVHGSALNIYFCLFLYFHFFISGFKENVYRFVIFGRIRPAVTAVVLDEVSPTATATVLGSGCEYRDSTCAGHRLIDNMAYRDVTRSILQHLFWIEHPCSCYPHLKQHGATKAP
jgi:hypothetical protein